MERRSERHGEDGQRESKGSLGFHGIDLIVTDRLPPWTARASGETHADLLATVNDVDYGERPGCKRNSNSVMPTLRCGVFRLHFLFGPQSAGSGNLRFQTTLHALRFSASFNQDLNLIFTLREKWGGNRLGRNGA
jgi:hypothetical protein